MGLLQILEIEQLNNTPKAKHQIQDYTLLLTCACQVRSLNQ